MIFPQLQTMSAFSLLKSTIQLEDYVKKAKELGYQTIALTDENQLTATIPFFQFTKKYQLQGILGSLLTITLTEETSFELLVYCKSQLGYQNLMALSTLKMTQGQLKLEELKKYQQDLVFIFPEESYLKKLWDTQQEAKLTDFLKQWEVNFTKEVTYIGIEPYERLAAVENLRFFKWLERIHQANWQPIFCHEVRYLAEDDAFSNRVSEAIGKQETLALAEVPKKGTAYLWQQSHFQSLLEETKLQETLHNTETFPKQFHFQPLLNQPLYPKYPLEKGQRAIEKLTELLHKNLCRRIPEVTEIYQKRLTEELAIIEKMGFSDYFLIVWDVLHYCHTHDIMTGAGRGSAAGSLVAYVLEITDVDPIEYDLLFERFLNPQRQNMPDIDIDIPDNKREEVLQYVKEKYGKEQVAQIATYGTLGAKMVLKDVARVFGYSISEANRLTKEIKSSGKISLKESYEIFPQFKQLILQNEKNQLLFQTALKLEGLPRHVSTHAAGVVIGDAPLVKWVPLQEGSNDIYLTQFTMGAVEGIGLLKMDFLGLKNLAILQETCQLVEKMTKKSFSPRNIPLTDEKTIQLFQKGDTAGIFQFESSGIRNVLRRLHPEDFSDIAAVNALYRPGPMENIDTFINRKNHKIPVTYLDKTLQPILKSTYGVIVYQEQVMAVAHEFAGFSLGEADILRRAVSKKKKETLAQQRSFFLEGATKKGHDLGISEKIYDYIEEFANFGFNKSHAVAYSKVAFQLAYLKAHYPTAFYTTLLNASYHNDANLKKYLGEAKQRRLSIEGPNINTSYFGFSLKEKNIQFGFSKIKGFRRDFAKEILAERKENGRYLSFDNFLIRQKEKWLKEEYLMPLIVVGAFDSFSKNRKKLLQELSGKIKNIIFSSGSMDLLNVMALKETEIIPYTLEERLRLEEEYLGLALSGHPLEKTYPYETLYDVTYIKDYEKEHWIEGFIYVKDVKKIRTKKGTEMAFLTGQDLTGETSYTLFPETYLNYLSFLKKGQILLVKGKVEYSQYQQQLQVIVKEVTSFEEIEKHTSKEKLFLKITTSSQLTKIKEVLLASPGKIPVFVYYAKEKVTKRLGQNFNVEKKEELTKNLKKILGETAVVYK